MLLPQESDLFLHAVEQYFPTRHGGPLVRADHLLDFVVLPLYGEQELGEDALVLLIGRLSGVLMGDA